MTSKPTDQGKGAANPASDDIKRKFREALDKKKAHGGADVSDQSERSKVESGHGPETSARQQMFRRKAGG
jgi:hypothetical protein